MSRPSGNADNWKFCTPEGARFSILLRGLHTTFREKLEWLEEAENLSLRFEINRRRAEAEGRLPTMERPEEEPLP